MCVGRITDEQGFSISVLLLPLQIGVGYFFPSFYEMSQVEWSTISRGKQFFSEDMMDVEIVEIGETGGGNRHFGRKSLDVNAFFFLS